VEEAWGDAGLSSPNVEIVRGWVEAFNRGEFDATIAALDPAVELHEWPTAPGARTYHGHAGAHQALEEWFEAWEWMRVEIEDLLEAGDSVLVTALQRAKGRGSAVEVEIRTFSVYTFRDGRVIRIHLFTELDPALEAAGLAPNLEEEKS
jgi:ketosteroid isomerase-like protein